MKVQAHSSAISLPLVGDLRRVWTLSLLVGVGMGMASVAGLVFQTAVYPTAAARQSYVVNDAVNLLLGLPILLGCMWGAQRGRLVGLLAWPGALLYVFYNYTALIFGRPLDWMALPNLALILLSGYAVWALLQCIDWRGVQLRLQTAVPVKFCGWVLVVYGALFMLLALNTAVSGLTAEMAFTGADLGLVVADALLSLLLIGGGVLLLRKRPLGFAAGFGLLFAASALFVGVILVLLLQPLLSAAAFDGVGVITLIVMSGFCFAACARFARAIGR